MTRGVFAVALASLGVASLVAAALAFAQDPVEPPPEAPEGADYAADPADSLEDGSVELGFGAAGRAGGSVQRRRRVRFSGGEVNGVVREGGGDPLSGGAIEGRGLGGAFAAGRLAPRWGRGLLLGAAGDPWRALPLDRGAHAAFRGRAGEGLAFRRGEDDAVEAMVGRFARRDLGAFRARARGLALGAIGARGTGLQSSLAAGEAGGGAELAFDARGRWRAEAALERPLGGWRGAARVRGGLASFRSLAEPSRAGPSRALTAALAGPLALGESWALGEARVTLAAWRFRPGVAGARAAFEIERRAADGARVVVGFEEQHGARRDAATAVVPLRQGGWGEWRSADRPVALAVRHEAWGDRAPLRGGLRVVSAARVEAEGPFGTHVRVTHATFRTRRGESVYLPEAESDRLILRALTGQGERTRVELLAPLAGGRAHLGVNLSTKSGTTAPPQWTIDWSRRSRVR